jgi:hypothetical protein
LSVYVTNNIDKFSQENANVYGKVRNSKNDDDMKLVLINQYNQLADDLPNYYYEELDLNVICDLILDLFRYKSKTIIDAQSLV